MAGWAGFTDEELQRLKGEASIQTSKKKEERPVKVANLAQPTKRPREKVFKSQHSRQKESEQATPRTASITKALEEAPNKDSVDNNTKIENSVKEIDAKNKDDTLEKGHSLPDNDANQENAVSKENEPKSDVEPSAKEIYVRVLSNEESANLELSALEQLQLKQKQIEEENKKKKKLIKDTLQERYKRAQSETHTLQTINKELSRLDEMLAVDVEILRSKIEEATIEFAHAQKRYDKAEKEFVNSKLDLQHKRDKKDDLTQHLYSIIKENEERKAKKLEELMAKLNLQNAEEVVSTQPTTES